MTVQYSILFGMMIKICAGIFLSSDRTVVPVVCYVVVCSEQQHSKRQLVVLVQ